MFNENQIHKAAQLLGCDLRAIKSAGEFTIRSDVRRTIDVSCRKIRNLIDSDADPVPPSNDILIRFNSLWNSGGAPKVLSEMSSRRIARRLAWSLDAQVPEPRIDPIISNPDKLNCALSIITTNISQSCVKGLFDALLKYWGKEVAVSFRSLIKSKIGSLKNSKDSVALCLTKHQNWFLIDAGPINLSNELVEREIKLDQIAQEVQLPANYYSRRYFSVMTTFYVASIIQLPMWTEFALSVLETINMYTFEVDDVKKCIVSIIIKIDGSVNSPIKLIEKTKSIAFEKIGDPIDEYKWGYWQGANDEDKRKIDLAREILNGWLNEQFIESFFNSVTMDKDRKRFWKNFINKRERGKVQVKMFLNDTELCSMKRNPRHSKHVGSRLCRLRGTALNSIVIKYKKYIFVEFSHTGNALYVYRADSTQTPNITSNDLYITDLRNTSLPLVASEKGGYYYFYGKEGRLIHREGSWGDLFNAWFKRYGEL